MKSPELTRWKVGHKIFTLFIQAALLALHNVEAYFLQGNRHEGILSLRNAANMMRMSALAMKYSADFQKGKYESIIRPSMPERFSGLGSMDHAYLIKVMARIKKNKERMRDFLVRNTMILLPRYSKPTMPTFLSASALWKTKIA
ncbi:Uncharacterised protein [Serratia plymuthica]|uniref:Uncharacterized protein n=1 Tax=Serratia plymuthica TaxID=82996 RepID=A0A2X4UZ36_SERPL|nr:Uncharacterised protein [Serratia plymuthica]